MLTDANNKNATSTPFTLTVSRGDITSEVDCRNANFSYGYRCDANNDSGTLQGYMSFSYDNGVPAIVHMNAAGHALFSIHLPVVGKHTMVITYPQ
jgi:hypothetical protein